MAAVDIQYRKTKAEVFDMLKNIEEADVLPETLLTIDYAFHNTDENYDDGLSFLDRLHRKLSKFYPIQWNLENMKNTVRNSNNPATTFVDMLNEILTHDMLACYGL